MKRCLYCYNPLEETGRDYHPICSKKIFGQLHAPQLDYTEESILQLGKEIAVSRVSVTGVQPKLSLDIAEAGNNSPGRFTMVGLWGNFILKPPTKDYPFLPEIEDLSMHLASLAKIKTVPHALIRLRDNKLAYITRRIDRDKQSKMHMEDMCQLTERLTEFKYSGSYEQVARVILKYSSSPLLDVIVFYEQIIFSFLIGNADMHLKNFSLIDLPKKGYVLSPAYDMLATSPVNPADTEELALTLNGKKRKIRLTDFQASALRVKIPNKTFERMLEGFRKSLPLWNQFIDISFLPENMKLQYKELIRERASRLNI